jgi:NAD(P)-dependent dehydrogenase (short-subunit alcohol dehydrogenase family)
MGKLVEKVCIVTGSSRGIGAEIARVFAGEGAKVVCAARTMQEGDHQYEGSLQSTVDGIRAAGGEATPVAVDLSVEDDCLRLVQTARDTYGPVDVLVNNAALTYFFPIKDYPTSRWMRSWAVNFHAPFILSREVLQDMVPRGSGSIVNVSSGAAIGPGRGPYDPATRRGYGGTCYGAEKAALERFTQGLAAEVWDAGVSVTCFSPSQVVPTAGTVHHKLVRGMDDPNSEPTSTMAQAALLLATEPQEKVSGRVTYSQQILTEFGWIDKGVGIGVDFKGSGYSLI